MNRENGITLVSLILYIIILTFVVGMIVNITAVFYSNAQEIDKDVEDVVEITKFNMYFLNDIKRKNIILRDNGKTYIKLSYFDENDEEIEIVYSMQNKKIYRNQVKICDNVDDISIQELEDGNIKIDFLIGNYKKQTTYVINNIEFNNVNITESI